MDGLWLSLFRRKELRLVSLSFWLVDADGPWVALLRYLIPYEPGPGVARSVSLKRWLRPKLGSYLGRAGPARLPVITCGLKPWVL